MAAEPEPRPFITKVWAKNFRSIEYAELELDPLTVLVGPNASGKSNLLDVLGFIADIARDGLEMAITRRGGIDSIGRRSPRGKALAPEFGFQVEFREGTLVYSVSLTTRGRVEYRVKREYARLEFKRPYKYLREIEFVNGHLTKPNLSRIARKEESAQPNLARAASQIIEAETRPHDLNLISEKSVESRFLTAYLDIATESIGNNPYLNIGFVLETIRIFLGYIGIYHIFPNSLRDPQKVADSHPLTVGGENLASTLRDITQNEARFLPELKEALEVAVPGVCDIRVKTAGSYYVVELKHKTGRGAETGLWLDLSHESDGTIRLLAMLTALFQDPAPSLIGLEEPELAIHPGAMAVLADVMKEASLRGQVVVATHSPDLINLLPIESIRAVTAEDGSTRVGRVVEHQVRAVKDKLFLPGELHSMEGLYPAGTGASNE